MAPSRSSKPAERRVRTNKACNHCRKKKIKCESIEYRKKDRPCKPCVLEGLLCSLARPSPQDTGSMQHGAAQSYTGVAMQPTTSTVHDVQWPVSSQASMGGRDGAPLVTYRGEGQGQLPFMQTQGISSPYMRGNRGSVPGISGRGQSLSTVGQPYNDNVVGSSNYGLSNDMQVPNYADPVASWGSWDAQGNFMVDPDDAAAFDETQQQDAGPSRFS
ncbi:hypothetical protein BDN67DRAFT_399386 [Paxillus ammoniavirescens]|nr:hypothetical protein BDN67DRAFT_399386 [Paxillus ammoniavirescens]